jgi:uncharacterized alpha-E superfamily protein
VLANLERLVIKPTAREGTGSAAVFGAALSKVEIDDLAREIEARPHLWVGQDPVALAAAPTLTDHGLEARRAVLRAFTVARADSYAAMPGGLTRVAPTRGDSVVSNQAGALSKDTWVLASEPETLTGFWLQGGRPITAVEPAGSMSARAAENLFWLGRYAERAEDVVRLLRAVHDRRTEFEHGLSPAGLECLRSLLVALTHVTTTYPGFVGEGAGERIGAPGPELRALEVDEHRAGSLAHSLRRLLEASHAVRDQLSGDTWIVIGSLDRSIPRREGLILDRRRGSQNSLSNVMTSLLAISGLGAECMVRDPGWHFMDAGRRIERALQLASLLRATVTTERDTATDSLLLESVLTTAESIITYRRRYRSQAQLETVLDLLVLDDQNPRSLVYQFDRLAESLADLPGTSRRDRLDPAQRLVLEASTALRLADTSQLATASPDGMRQSLDSFLARIIELLCMTADAIDATHFAHLLPQRALHIG